MKETKLSVADSFEILFQPLSIEDRQELENKLVTENIPQTVRVWNNTLVEQPDKYNICMEWEIPVSEKPVSYQDELEAGADICERELQRHDLTIEMRTFLTGRLFMYRHEIAARDFVKGNGGVISFGRRANRPKGMYEIAGDIAQTLNMAAGTVLKYGRYASALESIRRLEPTVAKAILSHKIRISHEDLQELTTNEDRLSILRKLAQEIQSSKRVNYFDIKKRIDAEKKKQDLINEKKIVRDVVPSIHEMPKFDPDADILNLIYTIPSWISSIDRAAKHTDFQKTTAKSNHKLANQIVYLREALERINQKLMEVE